MYPSTPTTPRAPFHDRLDDPNPVMFFGAMLYRASTAPCLRSPMPFLRRGAPPSTDLSIITYGMGAHWALELAEAMATEARPLKWWTCTLAGATGQGHCAGQRSGPAGALLLHEDTLTGGFGGRLAAPISRGRPSTFTWTPPVIVRVASWDNSRCPHRRTSWSRVSSPKGGG